MNHTLIEKMKHIYQNKFTKENLEKLETLLLDENNDNYQLEVNLNGDLPGLYLYQDSLHIVCRIYMKGNLYVYDYIKNEKLTDTYHSDNYDLLLQVLTNKLFNNTIKQSVCPSVNNESFSFDDELKLNESEEMINRYLESEKDPLNLSKYQKIPRGVRGSSVLGIPEINKPRGPPINKF